MKERHDMVAAAARPFDIERHEKIVTAVPIDVVNRVVMAKLAILMAMERTRLQRNPPFHGFTCESTGGWLRTRNDRGRKKEQCNRATHWVHRPNCLRM